MRCKAASTSAAEAPTVRPQKRTFSVTVKSAYRPLLCPITPTRCRTSSRSFFKSIPNTWPCPRSSGISPAHSRSKVVLPAPFGPRNNTISPRRTTIVAPANAGKEPSTATASMRSITTSELGSWAINDMHGRRYLPLLVVPCSEHPSQVAFVACGERRIGERRISQFPRF